VWASPPNLRVLQAEARVKGDKVYPATGINKYVTRYLRSLNPERGRIVLDIPCGDGRAGAVLRDAGMNVLAYDLFPDAFQVEGLQCRYADMTQPLPLGDEAVDIVVCQEGIEHVPNQLAVLEEFNRVLKPGGTLILTTPNGSHVRARVSRMLVGNDLIKYLPPSEVDGIWLADPGGKVYLGHLFLLEVNRLWVLSRLAGFDIAQIRTTAVSPSSVILGVFLAPLIMLCMLWAYLGSNKKHNPHRSEALQKLLWRQVRLNLSPRTLFCKHIFWILKKRDSPANCRKHLLRESSRRREGHE
jgi:SAM-dependent methyltransferase